MFDESLTPEQFIVITALTDGRNSTDAAAQAGVHRNTIANWRRNCLFFRESLADAQYDRALLFRDRMECRFERAMENLDSVLNDPNASPSVRLKAAMFVINNAITPPQPLKKVPFDMNEFHLTNPPLHKVHNEDAPATPAPAIQNAQNESKVHNGAQQEAPSTVQTIRREGPKVGRNDACPCGSGQKFKRCCLDKIEAKPQANTETRAA